MPSPPEESLLAPPGLTVNGDYLVPWTRVVSVRGPAMRGGRCTAVYYTLPASSPSCLPCLPSGRRAAPTRVVADVDDPSVHPSVRAHRALLGLRVLVVVNNAAGKGDAARSVKAVLAPVLRDAGLEVDVRLTECAGHGADLADEGAAAGVVAVVSVGGDGTLHEVLNGLLRTPLRQGGYPVLGVVPCGSGNAVAESLGLHSVLDAALNIVHGLRSRLTVPLTLMQYGRIMQRRLSDPALESTRASLAVGGLQWGLIADADLGTEKLRWMGNMRFDVGGLAGIVSGRTRYARIRLRIHRAAQAEVDKRLERSGGGARGRALERAGDQDVIIDGRFVTVVAWNCRYQSRTTAMTPYARLDEPCFDVVLVREGTMSRIGMLRTMLKLGSGTDAFLRQSDGFEVYKVTRICFEQLDGDFMSIDGEAVPVVPSYLGLAPESGKLHILAHTSSAYPPTARSSVPKKRVSTVALSL
jgi:sphingosine kinase